ncbi:prune protein [Danaus plexippus plexippus]|uniref:Prune protein n=1 Tax=Danaus plexippus plexippus TaxID=278856 RepID=A0A212FEC3_DANPL|nr:prune protein [Danaus plexippus plexippus]
MEEYLTTTITKLKANNYNELTLVLGNESCDLDSAVSALVYAAFLHWQYSQIKCKACTRKYRDESYKDDIFVPILDVERNDYPIKTDVVYCLKKHGIDETNLIFSNKQQNLISCEPLGGMYSVRPAYRIKFILTEDILVTKSKMSVVLTDHHFLSRRYDFLSPFVSEIIDHRPVVNASFNDIRTTIQTVGSCCTLVTHRIRDLTNLLAKDGDFFGAYPVTADLLHSVILLDTANFSKEVNKATPSDEDAVLYLECLIKPADYQKERSLACYSVV